MLVIIQFENCSQPLSFLNAEDKIIQNFFISFVWLWNVVSFSQERIWIKGVWKQNDRKNM